jgi:hypothetical protein
VPVPLILHPLDHLDLIEGAHAAPGDIFNQAGEKTIGFREAADQRGNFRLTERLEGLQPALTADQIEGLDAVVAGLTDGDGDGLFEAEFGNAVDDRAQTSDLVAHARVHDADAVHWDQADAFLVAGRSCGVLHRNPFGQVKEEFEVIEAIGVEERMVVLGQA